jgi:GAF domain-containing protein
MPALKLDQNGLSRCIHGQLIYEPDILPFPQRLAQSGLCSLVAALLLVESNVFGVLITARRVRSFTSRECEFLLQVSEHVALAAHQAQIYSALQQAYDDLRQTHPEIMPQERLCALGQMASVGRELREALAQFCQPKRA